jgi:hypothetical protein
MSATARIIFLFLLGFALLIAAAFFACGETKDEADTGMAPLTCDGKKTGDPCTGGLCYARDCDAGTICLPYCTNTGVACDAGGVHAVCSPFGDAGLWCTPFVPKGLYGCGLVPYDPCSSDPQTGCPPGQQCLEYEGTMTCFLICTDTCDAGDCTDTGFGFSVCVTTVE